VRAVPIKWAGPPIRCQRGVGGVKDKKDMSYRALEKKYWHLYSLQTLSSDKFVKIVNKILRKEYQLIK
jgi:hypothetical protein